jgi:16S rRNA (cytosine1402-N4)-methyltransferase
VIALDRDPTVLPRVRAFKENYKDRFEFCSGCFGDIQTLVKQPVDGFVFDIGVSSMQLDEAQRGFSFSKEAPLDMRMSCEGLTAADIVNTYSEERLADLLYLYGEEKRSRAIAKQIVAARQIRPIETTTELAALVYKVLHKKVGQVDPATRTFQALRIAVNDELTQLQKGLEAASEKLLAGGRLVVVDFHSLEDRIVKNFFKANVGKVCHVSRYKPQTAHDEQTLFCFASKVLQPQEDECAVNPRARSAKLRFARKRGECSDD